MSFGVAAEVGATFLADLQRLQQRFPHFIAEARGRGLMLGLEFLSPVLALSLVPRALRQGLILLPAGDGRVLEFVPPLTIALEQIAWAIGTLEDLLNRTS